MMKNETRKTIAILGAGPAGVATACGLSALGYRVVLIYKPRRRYAVEGISDRTLQALKQARCHAAMLSVGQQVAREVTWNGETSVKNREYILDRARFDRALLEDAESAGVALIEGIAKGIEPDGVGWRVQVRLAGAGHATTVECDFWVEARGRATPKRAFSYQRGPAALALSRAWRLPVPACASRLATFADGWGWFIAGDRGDAVLQLMTHGKGQGDLGDKKADPEQRYQHLMDNFEEAALWLAGAQPAGPVEACGAGMRLSPQLVAERYIAVGDAALAPDPLSGHGIFEALSSAITAIPVIHTLVQKPENGELARQFYQQRLSQRFLQLSRVGRDFYREEHRWEAEPYWQSRREWPDNQSAHPDPGESVATVAQRPVIQNGLIDSAEVVVSADQPLGVWQVSGVPLVPLLQQLQSGANVADAVAALQQPPEALQQACAWLRERRML